MNLYRITLDAHDSRPLIRSGEDQRRLHLHRARVRLYVRGWSPTDALSRVSTVYVRHSDRVVTLDGGLGHDRTAVSLPEWEIVTAPRIARNAPVGVGERLSTGGTMAGVVI